MADKTLAGLLKANPKARKQEALIKQALEELRKLRSDGFGSEGYTLTPPFGEKRQQSASQRDKSK